jgi:hypothetical protein
MTRCAGYSDDLFFIERFYYLHFCTDELTECILAYHFMTLHRISIWILYTLTIAAVIYLAETGSSYYGLSQAERPYSALHRDWRPSGVIGHGLGIVGSVFMVVLLLYSARKRLRFMQRAGNIRYWLNYHIWLGVTGPLLVIFHTTFKFGGIVAVSFWSMIGVALSGVLGRYLYLQIPHSLTGEELSALDLDMLDRDLQRQLQEDYKLGAPALAIIQQTAGGENNLAGGKQGRLESWVMQDVMLPFRLRKIRGQLRASAGISREQISEVMRLVRRRVKLRRRTAFLSTAKGLLHHWHIIHRPFAIVMLVIMVVHIVVTILFGYRWIF